MTLVALSTPKGKAAIAVIRISGPNTRGLIEHFLSQKNLRPRNATLCYFLDPQSKDIIDQVLAVFFEGPHSYTGEDLCELSLHGNPFLVQTVIDLICGSGLARMATPGEFSRRALENGKIDLLQAEALGQILSASTKKSLLNSQKILKGELSDKLLKLKNNLNSLLAFLEFDLDFAEEENLPDLTPWINGVEKVLANTQDLLNSWNQGRVALKQPTIGLFGRPNAGKSSLINSLLGRSRVLVSDIPGTTRDFVEVPLKLVDGEVLVIDTAGLGIPQDQLDQRAMEKTRELWEKVDYRIWVFDLNQSFTEERTLWEKEVSTPPDLCIATHSENPGHWLQYTAGESIKDLELLSTKNKLSTDEYIAELENSKSALLSGGILTVDAKIGKGLEPLLDTLNKYLCKNTDDESSVFLVSQRQYNCLSRALVALKKGWSRLKTQPIRPEEIAFEIRLACNELSELIGEHQPDDVYKEIFSQFCVGK